MKKYKFQLQTKSIVANPKKLKAIWNGYIFETKHKTRIQKSNPEDNKRIWDRLSEL